MDQELYSYSEVFAYADLEAYDRFNSRYAEYPEEIRQRESFRDILTTYLRTIMNAKFPNAEQYAEKIKRLGKSIVEHVTGNYEIGIGDADYFELTQHAETISSVIAYSDDAKLAENMDMPEELGQGISDGVIATGLIESPDQAKAEEEFSHVSDRIKDFFKTAISNIPHVTYHLANAIASAAGLDKEESQGLNDNVSAKFWAGLFYDLASGTLLQKRHFTDVRNSESMKKLIREEGILHFTAPANVMSILNSGYIKQSNILDSDVTAHKSFFFAGTPTFEDLLINIPAYNVMTAIRIRPTEEQIDKLKYRALNDRAVTFDGDFEFDSDQAEIAFFGLKYDKEKDSIYIGQIRPYEAPGYVPPKEVTDNYTYKPTPWYKPIKKVREAIKMNAYGFFAEYKHHQKLLKMQATLKERGIESFRDVNDATLVELSNIQTATVSNKKPAKGLVRTDDLVAAYAQTRGSEERDSLLTKMKHAVTGKTSPVPEHEQGVEK